MNINKGLFILIVAVLFSIETDAQKTINMDNHKFDIETFDKHKINKEYNFEVGDSLVRQIEFSNEYTTYITYKNNNFKDCFTYDKKKGNIKVRGQFFSNFPMGIFKYYDSIGIIIEEINTDYLYDFTVEQLIEKIKKEYGVDINVNDPTHILVTREDSPYPIYRVIIPEKDYGSRSIIVNGKNGETISEKDREGNWKEINPTPIPPKEEKKKGWFGF